MYFKDRIDAGRQLAAALLNYKEAPKTIVIGLPRGGVVVAAEVAKTLCLPLDIVVPRKIGAPDNEELGIGALAGDIVLLNQEIIAMLSVPHDYIERAAAKEKKEAERRLSLFRKGKPLQDFKGWTVLLVDDGIATGYTMRASIALLKKMKAGKIIAAVPVGPPDTIETLKNEANEVICLLTPSSFMAVGQFYEHFPQTEDAEVMELLHCHKNGLGTN